ncbi:uncharacterized protein MONBRDRAFT_7000 [Monosiga brevicollis MX1]|uniref:mitogen-activated protein kinase kinase n=1 Tax=Monosiga brevicollis TaxID=81824 RepID=A9UVL5_MONBE|nr:uncharacterized protein MONBRDRAFT_7000 [Monosiga brevicollis MX1]EDQ90417.1 predicted protein [Monosiga brevicollis MX1]|eukprot:XP_001744468.1 hypothetical protein [Monosiga brevicollis MX1]
MTTMTDVLINTKGEIKLCDFGLSKELDLIRSVADTYVGSMLYMSPERLDPKGFPHADRCQGDVWGLALTVAEVALGRFPLVQDEKKLSTMRELECVLMTLQASSPVLPSMPALESLLGDCIKTDPAQRATISALLERPCLQDVSRDPLLLWLRAAGYQDELLEAPTATESS